MKWTSILAIYSLFWVLSAFLVMPFGMKTHEEAGQGKVAGQSESAPADFRPRRIILRTTILAVVLFGVYYLNYVNEWIVMRDLNFFGQPPELDGSPVHF